MVHEAVDPSPLRTQARAVREQLYLQAARRIVIDGGLEALTMQRLADELNCAIGAVYRYFPSKDALIADLQRDALATLLASYDDTRATLDVQLEGEDVAAVALVRLLGFADFFAAAQALYPEELNLIMVGLTAAHTVIGDASLDRIAPAALALFERLRSLLTAAVVAGALEEGESTERAALWATALIGTLVSDKLARYDPGLFDARRLSLQLTEHLLGGWGADPAELAAAGARIEELRVSGPPADSPGRTMSEGERSA